MWAGRLVFSQLIYSLFVSLGHLKVGKVLEKRSKQVKTADFGEIINFEVRHSHYATFIGFGKPRAVQSYVSTQHP